MANHNAIFGFVAKSGSGKTTMVEAAARELSDRLQVVRSATTRARRGPHDDVHYEFFNREDFERMVDGGEFVYHISYAGNRYGILKREIERVLSRTHGILALVEESVRLLRADGYTVHVMKIVTRGAPEFPDPVRRVADEARARDPLTASIVIENDFTRPDGLQRATSQLVEFVRAETSKSAALTRQ
jgi:molybdopterin-guanine dinucleotide biosynthesis protein